LITSIIAWFLKNVNMLVGVVGAIGKVLVSVIHVWKPSQDNWVDKVEEWTEKIQKGLFKASEILKKFSGA